jgi:hypothetical protein
MVKALADEAVATRRDEGHYGNRCSDLLRAASRLVRHCAARDAKMRADAILERAYNYMAVAG